MIELYNFLNFFLLIKKTPIFKKYQITPLVKFLYFGWAALRYSNKMWEFYQIYENQEKPLTDKVALPGLDDFFEELEDIDWELRTLDEFKHYDVTLYKSILKNITLEDFGLYTWSFKQLYIFLISIGESISVKEMLIKHQENGLELFRVYCDF